VSNLPDADAGRPREPGAAATASQHDFAQVTLLNASVAAHTDAAPSLGAIVRLDRLALLLALVVIYLGLAVSGA